MDTVEDREPEREGEDITMFSFDDGRRASSSSLLPGTTPSTAPTLRPVAMEHENEGLIRNEEEDVHNSLVNDQNIDMQIDEEEVTITQESSPTHALASAPTTTLNTANDNRNRQRRGAEDEEGEETEDEEDIHPTDADDSIVLSDLLRTGEASRLRRRGAVMVRGDHQHHAGSSLREQEIFDHDVELQAEEELSGMNARSAMLGVNVDADGDTIPLPSTLAGPSSSSNPTLVPSRRPMDDWMARQEAQGITAESIARALMIGGTRGGVAADFGTGTQRTSPLSPEIWRRRRTERAAAGSLALPSRVGSSLASTSNVNPSARGQAPSQEPLFATQQQTQAQRELFMRPRQRQGQSRRPEVIILSSSSESELSDFEYGGEESLGRGVTDNRLLVGGYTYRLFCGSPLPGASTSKGKGKQKATSDPEDDNEEKANKSTKKRKRTWGCGALIHTHAAPRPHLDGGIWTARTECVEGAVGRLDPTYFDPHLPIEEEKSDFERIMSRNLSLSAQDQEAERKSREMDTQTLERVRMEYRTASLWLGRRRGSGRDAIWDGGHGRHGEEGCGCVKEGVGCLSCGNPLGTRYIPCQAAAETFLRPYIVRARDPARFTQARPLPLARHDDYVEDESCLKDFGRNGIRLEAPEGPAYWGVESVEQFPPRAVLDSWRADNVVGREGDDRGEGSSAGRGRYGWTQRPRVEGERLVIYTFFVDPVVSSEPGYAFPSRSTGPSLASGVNAPLTSTIPQYQPPQSRTALLESIQQAGRAGEIAREQRQEGAERARGVMSGLASALEARVRVARERETRDEHHEGEAPWRGGGLLEMMHVPEGLLREPVLSQAQTQNSGGDSLNIPGLMLSGGPAQSHGQAPALAPIGQQEHGHDNDVMEVDGPRTASVIAPVTVASDSSVHPDVDPTSMEVDNDHDNNNGDNGGDGGGDEYDTMPELNSVSDTDSEDDDDSDSEDDDDDDDDDDLNDEEHEHEDHEDYDDNEGDDEDSEGGEEGDENEDEFNPADFDNFEHILEPFGFPRPVDSSTLPSSNTSINPNPNLNSTTEAQNTEEAQERDMEWIENLLLSFGRDENMNQTQSSQISHAEQPRSLSRSPSSPRSVHLVANDSGSPAPVAAGWEEDDDEIPQNVPPSPAAEPSTSTTAFTEPQSSTHPASTEPTSQTQIQSDISTLENLLQSLGEPMRPTAPWGHWEQHLPPEIQAERAERRRREAEWAEARARGENVGERWEIGPQTQTQSEISLLERFLRNFDDREEEDQEESGAVPGSSGTRTREGSQSSSGSRSSTRSPTPDISVRSRSRSPPPPPPSQGGDSSPPVPDQGEGESGDRGGMDVDTNLDLGSRNVGGGGSGANIGAEDVINDEHESPPGLLAVSDTESESSLTLEDHFNNLRRPIPTQQRAGSETWMQTSSTSAEQVAGLPHQAQITLQALRQSRSVHPPAPGPSSSSRTSSTGSAQLSPILPSRSAPGLVSELRSSPAPGTRVGGYVIDTGLAVTFTEDEDDEIVAERGPHSSSRHETRRLRGERRRRRVEERVSLTRALRGRGADSAGGQGGQQMSTSSSMPGRQYDPDGEYIVDGDDWDFYLDVDPMQVEQSMGGIMTSAGIMLPIPSTSASASSATTSSTSQIILDTSTEIEPPVYVVETAPISPLLDEDSEEEDWEMWREAGVRVLDDGPNPHPLSTSHPGTGTGADRPRSWRARTRISERGVEAEDIFESINASESHPGPMFMAGAHYEGDTIDFLDMIESSRGRSESQATVDQARAPIVVQPTASVHPQALDDADATQFFIEMRRQQGARRSVRTAGAGRDPTVGVGVSDAASSSAPSGGRDIGRGSANVRGPVARRSTPGQPPRRQLATRSATRGSPFFASSSPPSMSAPRGSPLNVSYSRFPSVSVAEARIRADALAQREREESRTDMQVQNVNSGFGALRQDSVARLARMRGERRQFSTTNMEVTPSSWDVLVPPPHVNTHPVPRNVLPPPPLPFRHGLEALTNPNVREVFSRLAVVPDPDTSTSTIPDVNDNDVALTMRGRRVVQRESMYRERDRIREERERSGVAVAAEGPRMEYQNQRNRRITQLLHNEQRQPVIPVETPTPTENPTETPAQNMPPTEAQRRIQHTMTTAGLLAEANTTMAIVNSVRERLEALSARLDGAPEASFGTHQLAHLRSVWNTMAVICEQQRAVTQMIEALNSALDRHDLGDADEGGGQEGVQRERMVEAVSRLLPVARGHILELTSVIGGMIDSIFGPEAEEGVTTTETSSALGAQSAPTDSASVIFPVDGAVVRLPVRRPGVYIPPPPSTGMDMDVDPQPQTRGQLVVDATERRFVESPQPILLPLPLPPTNDIFSLLDSSSNPTPVAGPSTRYEADSSRPSPAPAPPTTPQRDPSPGPRGDWYGNPTTFQSAFSGQFVRRDMARRQAESERIRQDLHQRIINAQTALAQRRMEEMPNRVNPPPPQPRSGDASTSSIQWDFILQQQSLQRARLEVLRRLQSRVSNNDNTAVVPPPLPPLPLDNMTMLRQDDVSEGHTGEYLRHTLWELGYTDTAVLGVSRNLRTNPSQSNINPSMDVSANPTRPVHDDENVNPNPFSRRARRIETQNRDRRAHHLRLRARANARGVLRARAGLLDPDGERFAYDERYGVEDDLDGYVVGGSVVVAGMGVDSDGDILAQQNTRGRRGGADGRIREVWESIVFGP